MAEKLPPIDESVKVPRGVLASSAKAEEIHKQAYPGDTPPPANGDAPEPVKTEATPPAPTHPTPPVTPPASEQPPPETAEDWKQRYTSLKGRFEVQAGQVANQATRLASLESLVSTLQRPAPAPNNRSAAPARPATKRVTDADVTEYGKDLIEVVQKAALDAIEPILDQRVAAVRTEVQTGLRDINSKVGGVERETAVTAHQRLLDYLDKNEAQWRVVNRHPKFHTWLGLTDPLSGVIRKNLLNDAVKRGDAARAITFYRQFLAEEGVPAPANGYQPPPPPAGGNGVGKVDLASLAAPGRPAASGGAPAVPDKNGEIITRAQVSAFYANKSRNMYTPEEAARLEAEVFAASKEGRIR